MIKVYISNYCPYCTRAKNYLDLLGIEYESVNIQQDSKALKNFSDEGYQYDETLSSDSSWVYIRD